MSQADIPGMGLQAARQFYQLLQAKNQIARARWQEILLLARQGDLEAVRAVRLMQAVIQATTTGATSTGAPTTDPAVIAYLKLLLIQACACPPTGPG